VPLYILVFQLSFPTLLLGLLKIDSFAATFDLRE
jgi:hypothetical protein